MRKQLDAAFTAILVLSAITLTSAYGYKTFYPSVQTRAGVPPEARKLKDWSKAIPYGYTIHGDSSAKVTMLVFSDFECPACKGFHSTVLARLPDSTSRRLRAIYLNYPLSYHRFALPAARVADCLNRRGSIRAWADLVFRKQDSLGLKSWEAYAKDAGFGDLSGINKCASDTTSVPNIDASIKIAGEFGVKGTPAVIIDGWLMPGVPRAAQIDSAIAKASERF